MYSHAPHGWHWRPAALPWHALAGGCSVMRWLREWLRRLFGQPPGYVIAFTPDTPNLVKRSTLYLVGERGRYWMAVMRCPCGCGDDIHLPLSGQSGPRWTVSGLDEAPTLSPSVNRTANCHSHFFLRRGRIVWLPTLDGKPSKPPAFLYRDNV